MTLMIVDAPCNRLFHPLKYNLELSPSCVTINIFVNSVYLYDDYLTLVINASKTPVSEKNIPLGGIEETLDESTAMGYSCSAQSLEAPP